jgi:peptide/nickel transport system permease protein
MRPLRRLILAAATVAGVLLLGTLLEELAPGDALTDLALSPHLSVAARAQLRERYGLDQPAAIRLGRWLAGTLKGDLGFSIAYQRPVGELIWPRWKRTALVGALAFLLAWGTALPLAAAAALAPGSFWRRALMWLDRIALSVPTLALAPLVIAAVLSLGWNPLRAGSAALLLSALVLGAVEGSHALPPLTQAIQAGLSRPFVRAARARGRLWPGVLVHALRAESPKLSSLAALAVAHLLTGAVVVEAAFGYPGLGLLALEAVVARDPHLLVATLGVVASTVVGANLAADGAVLWLAPPASER